MYKRSFSHYALVSLAYSSIILSQAFLLASRFEIINFVNNRVLFKKTTELIRGSIFFTGELNGIVSECADCQRTIAPLPKAAAIIRSLDSYLYFDIGNFTSGARPMKSSEISFYRDAFEYLRLNAINLTKKDSISLHNSPYTRHFNFLSLNLLPVAPEENINTIGHFPLEVSNATRKEMVSIAVTGLSDNRRMAGEDIMAVEIQNQVQALAALSKMEIGSTVLLVLYHDSEFNLSKFLYDYRGPHITLVIGCYGNTLTNEIKHIGKVPYVYIGNRGRYLGRMTLYFDGLQLHSFNFRLIEINESYPDDTNIKNMADIIRNNIM